MIKTRRLTVSGSRDGATGEHRKDSGAAPTLAQVCRDPVATCAKSCHFQPSDIFFLLDVCAVFIGLENISESHSTDLHFKYTPI